jgi:hypothetical protein
MSAMNGIKRPSEQNDFLVRHIKSHKKLWKVDDILPRCKKKNKKIEKFLKIFSSLPSFLIRRRIVFPFFFPALFIFIKHFQNSNILRSMVCFDAF